jgi:hypothetical protein
MEKKFFRVRLNNKCSANAKMVNGVTLTKQWLMKTGDAGEFARFPEVETQAMTKRGNAFVPAEETPEEDDGGETESSESVAERNADSNTTDTSAEEEASSEAPDFSGMTVERLKNFLIANGASQSELRSLAKQELIELAQSVWARNAQSGAAV